MKQDVINFLDGIGIIYDIIDHPAVFTVDDITKLPKEIKPIKNLLLQEDDGNKKFLVVTDGMKRLDLKQLRNILGSKRLRFASRDTLMNAFGVEHGSVSIFGFLNPNSKDVELVIDKDLLDEPEISFHPNENTSTILFKTSGLNTILSSLGCNCSIVVL